MGVTRLRTSGLRAKIEKLTSGFLFRFLSVGAAAAATAAADIVGGWQASSIAGTWRCTIPAGFGVLD